MQIRIPKRKMIRTLALTALPLYVLLVSTRGGAMLSAGVFLDAFLLSDFIILAHPLGHEDADASMVAAPAMFLCACALVLMEVPVAPYVPACVILFLLIVYRTCQSAGNLRRMFRNDTPWLCAECSSRQVSSLGMAGLAVFPQDCLVWPRLALAAIGLAILYHCARSGHLMSLSPKGEETLKNMIKGDLRSLAAASYDEDTRMNALYARVVAYMEEKRPYLDENFSLKDLSLVMYTNKTYLSRVINYYSGRNFKQFVNYYRVMYSVDMIRKDAHLTVMELATMSGFHSVVTYNMAFRINMNDTPGSFSKNCPRNPPPSSQTGRGH